MKKSFLIFFALFFCFSTNIFGQIPTNTLVQIVKAEDERRFDTTLIKFLDNPNESIRKRTALAIGRIGDENSIPILVGHLKDSPDVVEMIVFAIGEIESVKGSSAILDILKNSKSSKILARALEAAGKIAAANPKDALTPELGKEILSVVSIENEKRSAPNDEIILAGLTAILRARPEGGEKVATEFLRYSNPRIVADALNTLARLRSKIVNEKSQELLKNNKDAVVRANAARMLGVGEDKTAIDLLLNAATKDEDSRVRVSAIRSLGSLKDANVSDKLIEYGEKLLTKLKTSKSFNDVERSELLEITTVLGRLLPNTNNQKALNFLTDWAISDKTCFHSPENVTALARIAPKQYVDLLITKIDGFLNDDWRELSAIFQGASEIANLPATKENDAIKSEVRVIFVQLISQWVDLSTNKKDSSQTKFAIPELFSAFAAFKSDNTSNIFRPLFELEPDEQIRATIAGILANQPASKENIEALKKAFAVSILNDKTSNDAQLAILDALFKVDKKEAVGTLLTALNAPDYLVRKKAYTLLKTEGLDKDFPGLPTSLANFTTRKQNQVLPYTAVVETKLGQVLNTNADYIRAVSRKNGTVKAVLTTTKGTFTINFTPEDAPLTVDNFVKLAKSNYFNGLTVHRVVPNFVMQDGDPRGDGNGGPAWSIRCEVNMLTYERGTVGMALSGKDTGGSQWFVTHSPQPHLDGGYTVFGKVNETDIKIVDSIVRGDKILSVKIIEGNSPPKSTKGRKK